MHYEHLPLMVVRQITFLCFRPLQRDVSIHRDALAEMTALRKVIANRASDTANFLMRGRDNQNTPRPIGGHLPVEIGNRTATLDKGRPRARRQAAPASQSPAREPGAGFEWRLYTARGSDAVHPSAKCSSFAIRAPECAVRRTPRHSESGVCRPKRRRVPYVARQAEVCPPSAARKSFRPHRRPAPLPRSADCAVSSWRRRETVMASRKPTFCSSSTALRVGATAVTSRPDSRRPRSISCSVAVLPVPAAPRKLMAKSRESSICSTARFCSSRKCSAGLNSCVPPSRPYRSMPWFTIATKRCSRSRLSCVASRSPA